MFDCLLFSECEIAPKELKNMLIYEKLKLKSYKIETTRKKKYIIPSLFDRDNSDFIKNSRF